MNQLRSPRITTSRTDGLPESLLKSYFCALPIVRIELPYHPKKKGGRILVEVHGEPYTVEDAARLLLEERGFTVLKGDEVFIFILFFLINEKQLDEGSLYGDTFLNWVVHNGYSKKEADRLRSSHRTLVEQYMRGDDFLFTPIVDSALDLAQKYYLPNETPGRGEADSGADIRVCFQETEEMKQKHAVFIAKKKIFLKTIVDEFFKKCLPKEEARRLMHACVKTNSCTGGVPDLFVFSSEEKTWFFVEVKSASGPLRPYQYTWAEVFNRHIGGHMTLIRILPLNKEA
jgi:hypothetical protein